MPLNVRRIIWKAREEQYEAAELIIDSDDERRADGVFDEWSSRDSIIDTESLQNDATLVQEHSVDLVGNIPVRETSILSKRSVQHRTPRFPLALNESHDAVLN